MVVSPATDWRPMQGVPASRPTVPGKLKRIDGCIWSVQLVSFWKAVYLFYLSPLMCVCGSQQEVRLLGRSEWLLFMHDLQWLSHTRVKIVWQPPYDYRENGRLPGDCIDFFFLHSVGKCKKLQWPTGTRKNINLWVTVLDQKATAQVAWWVFKTFCTSCSIITASFIHSPPFLKVPN